MKDRGRGFTWLDAFLHTNRGFARFINRLPVSTADSCKDRCAVSCALFGFKDFHFMAVNIGLNLPPKL